MNAQNGHDAKTGAMPPYIIPRYFLKAWVRGDGVLQTQKSKKGSWTK